MAAPAGSGSQRRPPFGEDSLVLGVAFRGWVLAQEDTLVAAWAERPVEDGRAGLFVQVVGRGAPLGRGHTSNRRKVCLTRTL